MGSIYSISKMTNDRIGKDHLGTDTYSRREKLAFASMSSQIETLRATNCSLSVIAEYLGISKSSIWGIKKELEKLTVFGIVRPLNFGTESPSNFGKVSPLNFGTGLLHNSPVCSVLN